VFSRNKQQMKTCARAVEDGAEVKCWWRAFIHRSLFRWCSLLPVHDLLSSGVFGSFARGRIMFCVVVVVVHNEASISAPSYRRTVSSGRRVAYDIVILRLDIAYSASVLNNNADTDGAWVTCSLFALRGALLPGEERRHHRTFGIMVRAIFSGGR